MERVWNGYPAQHHFSGIAFDGLERRGLERNSLNKFEPLKASLVLSPADLASAGLTAAASLEGLQSQKCLGSVSPS